MNAMVLVREISDLISGSSVSSFNMFSKHAASGVRSVIHRGLLRRIRCIIG